MREPKGANRRCGGAKEKLAELTARCSLLAIELLGPTPTPIVYKNADSPAIGAPAPVEDAEAGEGRVFDTVELASFPATNL